MNPKTELLFNGVRLGVTSVSISIGTLNTVSTLNIGIPLLDNVNEIEFENIEKDKDQIIKATSKGKDE